METSPRRAVAAERLRQLGPWIVYGVAIVLLAPARPMGPTNFAATSFALFAPAVALTLHALRFDFLTIGIVLGAVGLDLVYLTQTAVGLRNYDAFEQLKYIGFIAHGHALPSPEDCFVCHHPPLYYLVAASVQLFFERTGLTKFETGLQCFSLLLFIVFVTYSALLVRLLGGSVAAIRLATALVALWPYSIQSSIRVHNDSLIAPLMVGALYHTVRWYSAGRALQLYLAAVACALALVTKSSGVVSLAVLILVIGVRLIQSPRLLRQALPALAIVAAGLATNVEWKSSMSSKGQPTSVGQSNLCTRVLGTACRIGPQDFSANKLSSYLTLDLRAYASEPFLIAHRGNNRDHFWNALLKSSLLGTHNNVADPATCYRLNAVIAVVMGWLLLAMIVYGIVALDGTLWRSAWIVIATIAAALVFLIGFRALIPAAHHNDFRHVFVILPAAAALFALGSERLAHRNLILGRAGQVLAVVFVALSVAFHVPKYDWAMAVSHRTIQLELASRNLLVPEGTDWDDRRNVLFEGSDTLEFALPQPRDVSGLSTSLDGNDVYELTLHGAHESRRVVVGPSNGPTGLARYHVVVDPVVEGVSVVQVRAVSGDAAYALGDLRLESHQ